MDNVFIQFRDKFIKEALGLVKSLEKSLIQLENNISDKQTIQEIFRFAHTLKGVSGMYGFSKVEEYTHKLETLFDSIQNETLEVNTEIIDLTLQSADHIKNLLFDFDFAQPENKANQISLLEKLKRYVHDDKIKIKNSINKKELIKKRTYYISFTAEESLIFRGVKIINIFRDLAELGTFEIFKHQPNIANEPEKNDEDTWGIILTTQETKEAIDDVFMFVEDNYKLYKLSENNLFEDSKIIDKKVVYADNIPLQIADLQKLSHDELTDIISKNVKEKIEDKIEEKTKTKETKSINKSDFSKKILSQTINVDTEKLDTLMYLVSEFVTSNAQLKLGFENADTNQLKLAVEKMEKLSKQFRENAFSLRLIPIQENIVSFQRLVRDLSKNLGKKVNFKIEGGETELDKSILDKLTEPLMHLVRNSIDHGIEMPDQRIAAGKQETGTIKFKAEHRGSHIIITISDDGCGIKKQKITKKAIERGIITKDKKLTDKEIYDLIFMPGFSTVESLTKISGRGVGMDIVKKKITELRGEIKIISDKGKGTKFIIKLQQTVSIIDTLLFKLDDMYFTIPIADIEKCDLIETNAIEKENFTKTVPFNNKLIPFIDLHKLYDLKLPEKKNLRLIIINKQENSFAIAADRIIGEHQAVLKSIGKNMKKQENIAGVSILGDGNIAFLLDIAALQRIKN